MNSKLDIVCNACGSKGDDSSFVQLWDDKKYCGRCVPKGSPLFKLATANHPLVETMPFTVSEVVWSNVLAVAIAALVCFLLFSCIAFSVVDADTTVTDIILLVGSIGLIATAVSTLFLAAAGIGYYLNRPTILVESGEVQVKFPHSEKRFSIDVIAWYEGGLEHSTNHPRQVFMSRCKAIILEVQHGGIEVFRPRIAVGLTEVSRKTWRQFLEVAGIPQKTSPWDKSWF